MFWTKLVHRIFVFFLILTLFSGYTVTFASSYDPGPGYIELGIDAETWVSMSTGRISRTIAAIRSWDESTMLTERSLTRRQEGLEIRGTVPHLTSEFGVNYERINNYIADYAVSSLIENARSGMTRARSIKFSHEAHHSGNVVSLVIFAEVDSSVPRTLVRTVNFNATSGRMIGLREAITMDITQIIERKIAEMIRSNPEHYYAAQTASLENLSFYVTDNRVVILFNGLTLSTRDAEVSSISFARRNLHSFSISRNEYHVRDYGYSLKRIPLRSVTEGLGFTLTWNSATSTVAIFQNRQVIAELTLGYNNFIANGGVTISLEEGPLMIEDRLYVPITFFDQVLPLTVYSVSSGGRITFVTYQE